MAPYKYEKLPSEPILIYTANEDYRVKDHLTKSMEDAWKELDAQTEPVFYINDLSRQAKLALEDLLVAASSLTRGNSAPYHHPNIRRLIIVTTDTMLRLGYKGASSEVFGRLQVEIFDTLEEALEYARAQLT